MTNEITINGYSLDFYKTFDHNNLEEMRLEADDGYINFLLIQPEDTQFYIG